MCLSETGDIEHLLVHCSELSEVREKQWQSLLNKSDFSQVSVNLILNYWEKPTKTFVQLLLDCSVLPEVIVHNQNSVGLNVMQDLFKFGRTWCYNVHARRMKLLGRWRKCY